MQITLTFEAGEADLFEAFFLKCASLGSFLKERAVAAVPERQVGKVRELGMGYSAPDAKLNEPVPDDPSDEPAEHPFFAGLGGLPPVSETVPDKSAGKKRGSSRKSGRITTENVLAGGPVDVRQPLVGLPAGKEAPLSKDVPVEQLQKLSTDIVARQPDDRKKVMDLVYSYVTAKGVKANNWKDLDATQRFDALKKLQSISLNDAIPDFT